MLSCSEGKKHGLTIVPLSVTIGHESWLENEEISKEEFLKRVRSGGIPSSAAPSIGMTIEAYDCEEEVLHVAMADGFSGAYDVACSAKTQARHPDRVHVLNSETMCIPQRALVYRAMELLAAGTSKEELFEQMHAMIASANSYLVPEDFDFLRRGGRLTPMAARFASILKVIPVMTVSKDRLRIEKMSTTRTIAAATRAVEKSLRSWGLRESYYISVSHADNYKRARKIADLLKEAFPKNRMGIFNLGPAFITQGGPGCVAIQCVDLAGSSIDPSSV